MGWVTDRPKNASSRDPDSRNGAALVPAYRLFAGQQLAIRAVPQLLQHFGRDVLREKLDVPVSKRELGTARMVAAESTHDRSHLGGGIIDGGRKMDRLPRGALDR